MAVNSTPSYQSGDARGLYAAYRQAQGAWEAAAGREGDVLSDAENGELCEASEAALLRFLRSPANDALTLARKLKALREEEAQHAPWFGEILDTAIGDADRLAVA